ncbi:NUDIX hydrolase [Pseudonocardia yuanmonensis]|uniref:NUDIX hydrolase n=1 Tax=Pseudonocardia yuanmonensis TaxID=1095914 RepID=A0ABP8VVK9_9PSEU
MSDLYAALGADVLAGGTVLWRATNGGPQVALVHRPKYDDWGLPKGKLDNGETLASCALRETWEETGVRARLGARLGDVRYLVPEGSKLVRYWAAEALEVPDFGPNTEIDELVWVPPAEAVERLSYAHDVEILRRFTPPATVLLLVRHAKAGSRKDWDDDDDLRPLSGVGRTQAEHMTEFLAGFAPERLHSAPPVRCVDTIAPYGTARGLKIEREPLLGEEGYWVDPAAGLARFRELLALPGVTVLCSQGGVIPDVVENLLDESAADVTGVPDPEKTPVPSRKGSTWVLTTDGTGALRTADYYPSPT